MQWEREEWIQEYLAGEAVAAIAERHEISRKALHKWIARYGEFGAEGLADLSRAPQRHAKAVDPVWQERISAARQQHWRWGAPKLHWLLRQQYGDEGIPSISTIGRVLKQQGLSRGGRRRPPRQGSGSLHTAGAPNEVWCVDFKGWRRTGDGQRCYPLTVTDQRTRYLLCCQAMPAMRTELVRPVLERVFRQYGLPERMRSDNGAPFGDGGQGGLTELAVWWIEVGVQWERIEPGRPQQNGRHERMHRTLGEETMDPPAATLRQQQKRFDEFREEYNHERPHQALDQQLPAALYQAASRAYPRRLPEAEYGRDWQIRRVGDRGQIRWHVKRVFIGHALEGKPVGLERW